jgi:hypothetical protein
MRWEAIMWVFVGAVFGIIVNWITSDPIVVSRTSIIVTVIFVVVTGIIWFAARDYKKRADVMKSRILEFRKSSQPFTKNPK